MPKVFLRSDQMFLFHQETFQCFHPYSTFHYIFQFLNCLEKEKRSYYNVNYFQSQRSWHKKRNCKFATISHIFQLGGGGQATIYRNLLPAYFLFAPISHQMSYITKGKPLRLHILSHCLRLYEQKNIYLSQRCHYCFPDWFLLQNQQKCKKCYN